MVEFILNALGLKWKWQSEKLRFKWKYTQNFKFDILMEPQKAGSKCQLGGNY